MARMVRGTGPDANAGREGGGTPGDLERRQFVREGFRNLLKPIRRFVESRIERIRAPASAFGGTASAPAHPADPESAGRVIRPPGAIREERFLERCSRSGRCVAACPVHAIRPIEGDGPLKGTPSIDPRSQPCVVCEGLYCMKACPGGALAVVPRARIEMGVAQVLRSRCLRSFGDECQACVDRCPLGRAAIEIPYFGGPVEVKPSGCVGCGVCEWVCPADPSAILVRPIG